MAQNKQGMLAVCGMIMVVLAGAVLIPAVILNLGVNQSQTIAQTESERIIVSGSLSSEAIDIESGGNAYANISLVDENTGEVVNTGQIMQGQNVSVTINQQILFVEVDDVVSKTQAIITYTYPTYIGIPNNVETLFSNISLILVVCIVVMLSGVILVVSEVRD